MEKDTVRQDLSADDVVRALVSYLEGNRGLEVHFRLGAPVVGSWLTVSSALLATNSAPASAASTTPIAAATRAGIHRLRIYWTS